MSSGVRVPSEFAVHTLLDNFPVESPTTDKNSCTKSVYKCIRKGMPLYNSAALQALAVDAAPQCGAPQRDEEV